MSGNRWGPEGPPPEVYSRLTAAERFRRLHDGALEADWRLPSKSNAWKATAFTRS